MFFSGWEAVFLDLILLIAVHCSVILLLLLLSLFLGGWRRNFVECVFYKLQIELLSIYQNRFSECSESSLSDSR
jgi:hypothetical protein